MPGVPEVNALPAELLRAVAECRGLAVLVVGAGSSRENPTGLELTRVYALDVHRKLLLDGLLDAGECPNPEDLSAVASATWARHGTQAPVVARLPRAEFRMARPNDGHLIAAALLREGAISAVLTLNFDLAMSAALTKLSASEVEVIVGPEDLGRLGAKNVVYMHRNVDESDFERWVLRREALDDEWRGGWEELLAQRVMTTPVTVFAGLGSPAGVLTEMVRRISGMARDALKTYLVEPYDETAVKIALGLPERACIRLGWCAFMRQLDIRVAAEQCAALERACRDLCEDHDWAAEVEHIPSLCSRFASLGLVFLGRLRARWLLDRQEYVPDDARRELIADLLLAIGLIERQLPATPHFRDDGIVEFRQGNRITASCLLASGRGSLSWTALEAKVQSVLTNLRPELRPAHAIVNGLRDVRPQTIAPPLHVISGQAEADILGERDPLLEASDAEDVLAELITVDELRVDPATITKLAA